MWQKVIAALDAVIPTIVKQYLVPPLAAVAGITNSIWIWLMGWFINKEWTDKVDPTLHGAAAGADETVIENQNLKKLDQAEKSGDLDAIAKAGADVLNG